MTALNFGSIANEPPCYFPAEAQGMAQYQPPEFKNYLETLQNVPYI